MATPTAKCRIDPPNAAKAAIAGFIVNRRRLTTTLEYPSMALLDVTATRIRARVHENRCGARRSTRLGARC
jgi:hypothetical protein